MTSKKIDLRAKLLSDAATKFSKISDTGEQQTVNHMSALAEPTKVGLYPQSYKAPLTISRTSTGTRIRFSHGLYLKNLLEWNDALWKETKNNSIELDFSSTKFFSPLSLLFIPHQVREFYKQHPEVRLHVVGHQHLEYPAHMGFFDCLGGAFGKTMGEAPGDQNYLPISTINLSQFIKDSGARNVRDAIDSETKRLARVLVRTQGHSVLITRCRGPAAGRS